ncbi:DUF262 domain-containing protein [Mesorhizobium sp.]|uniref:DUF262 domain-containing protein n=1 Tax=Mesorhizobium sp. TaxID=1871066 RepID=UPI0012075B0C|nr:DUF262 domain-containing protein [Mesorhizobium sp.]TIM10236.1 MAG: DUF262 domain-containing protein [Mesorhizobium sp.]
MDDSNDLFSNIGEVSEDDLNIKPKDFQEMVVAPTDWTIGVLVDLLKRKKIDLQPNYQRRIAWTADKMSKFIESLFLRLPVPQIVLAETQPGRFAVIDGKQRLNSLARFCLDMNDPLRLKGCEYRADLEGLTYEEMQQKPALEGALDAFQSHTVRTTVIKNWSNELLYLLFLRLNQNSVTLSPQELRRALFPGPFVNWLDDKTSASPGMQMIFSKVPDFRMRDMEVATRYIGFQLFGASYVGNMKQFLDDVTFFCTKNWKDMWPVLEEAWQRFETAVDATTQIFGGDAYKVWQDGRFLIAKNRAVMDIMNYYFSQPQTAQAAIQHAGTVRDAFRTLCDNNEAFVRSLQVSTKTEDATQTRFSEWRQVLTQTLGNGVIGYPSHVFQF